MSISFNEYNPLERYGCNLTMLAQQRAFSPLIGHEAAVSRVFQILQRKNKCNPVILDQDNARRWLVVAEVIRRMTVGDVPEPFSPPQVIALDYEALFTNFPDDQFNRQKRKAQIVQPSLDKFTPTGEDSEDAWAGFDNLFRWPSLQEWIAPTMVLERLQALFIAMHQAASPFLLFVDHIHRLVGGEWERYPINAINLLKPVLARNQVQLIGACNLEQYRQYIEQDAALQRRFQEVCLFKSFS